MLYLYKDKPDVRRYDVLSGMEQQIVKSIILTYRLQVMDVTSFVLLSHNVWMR